ncbi:unnamed protein product [Calypogeia fissa]
MATRWWSKDTVAVVTGSNKGIGFEIVRGLAKNGVTTVLTARDNGRGQAAADSLKAQGLNSVIFHQLDVTSAESIDNLAVWLKEKFGGLDILVNNAGVYLSGGTYEGAKATLDINYYGVKSLTDKLLPILRPGARVVTISSALGRLSFVGDSLAKILGDEKILSEDLVDSYAKKYLDDVQAGRWKEEGWSTTYPQYADSKVLLNAYTRAFAKTLSKRPEDQKIFVNVVHPGYIGTDLNNNAGTGTPEEGADTAVWLSLLPEKNYPQGAFFFKREPYAW